MGLKLATAIILSLFVAGCVTTAADTNSRPSARTGSYSSGAFAWRDMTGFSPVNSMLADPSNGAKVYLVSYSPANAGVQLSNGRVFAGTPNDCFRMVEPTWLLEECYNKVVNAGRQAEFTDRDSLVSAARQAIRADGRCTWMGYDPSFDARVRAIGALASQSDNRLFFVAMRCS